MISLRFDQLADMTGGKLAKADMAGQSFTGVSIDSRTVNSGALFIALPGEQTDGHKYVAKAVSNGAAGLLVEENKINVATMDMNVPLVSVPNSHEAMIKLAAKYRDTLPAKFVGITGSNGKTSTKEFTYQLLSSVIGQAAYRSPGNFNNLFGAPLALMAIPRETKVAVMELGISTNDEMPRLAQLVHPDVALFTNVGPSHLEFLKTVDDVAKAKLELITAGGSKVTAIVNSDDKILMRHITDYCDKPITFSLKTKADYNVDSFNTESSGNTTVTIDGHKFVLPFAGLHHVYNLLAAYSVCRTLGYDFGDTETIKFDSAPMRGQIITRQGIRFVADCYNANPDSMAAALASFFELKTDNRKVLVLGDMLELGLKSEYYHKQLGQLIASYQPDFTIMVGPLSKITAEAAIAGGVNSSKIKHCYDAKVAASTSHEFLQVDDLVLLKASRGIGLEKVLNRFDINIEEQS